MTRPTWPRHPRLERPCTPHSESRASRECERFTTVACVGLREGVRRKSAADGAAVSAVPSARTFGEHPPPARRKHHSAKCQALFTAQSSSCKPTLTAGTRPSSPPRGCSPPNIRSPRPPHAPARHASAALQQTSSGPHSTTHSSTPGPVDDPVDGPSVVGTSIVDDPVAPVSPVPVGVSPLDTPVSASVPSTCVSRSPNTGFGMHPQPSNTTPTPRRQAMPATVAGTRAGVDAPARSHPPRGPRRGTDHSPGRADPPAPLRTTRADLTSRPLRA